MNTLIEIGGLQLRFELDGTEGGTAEGTASASTEVSTVLMDFRGEQRVALLSDSDGDTLLVAVMNAESGAVLSAHLCLVEEVAGYRLASIGGREVLDRVPPDGLSDAIQKAGRVQVEQVTWWNMRSHDTAPSANGVWRPHGWRQFKHNYDCLDDAREGARQQAARVFGRRVADHIHKFDTAL
jgi:hypothetical protein